ncbi:class I adenylate-forming enzyme family protein [Azohydromonas sediminis]|uniref:class I adenylate-forming enzyme family protein n=1 Tax=Azohydromonas sediminis TaxID=2259674 RepID=UPI000E65226C|nr:AMP-binding protein [Azohydromonas sediminis]
MTADGPWARIAAQAARRGDAPALVCGPRTWTYADLAREVTATADALRAQGLGAGASLGWLGLNSAAMLAALFACEAIGARFVPLNWRLAPAELAAIVEHAGVQQLHVDAALEDLGRAVRALVALPQPHAPGHQPGDLMLVYTSGTTGRPKGAIHTAAGMVANIDAAIDAQGFDERTCALAVLPLFHVGGLCIQTLPVLAAGGCVVLHERFDPGAWLAAVAHEQPTTSLLVPAVMRALLEHPAWATTDLGSLAFVNSGSQVVPVPLIEAFHARGVPVCQVWGSTETGPVSIVLRPHEALAHVGSTGRPAHGVQMRLVGADGRDVAPGEVGEIWVRAPNLMRGYHRDEHPASFADGWFRSGDLARADAQGFVTVVGRSKDMIISGGENVYPAEIENLLAHHPDIAECAVVGVPDARWGEVPVLAVVPRPGRGVDEAALRALFDARLARYKHPRRIVAVDALPKTALGKVQKAALARSLAGS